MKLTKSQLKEVIQEAYNEVLLEDKLDQISEDECRRLALFGEGLRLQGTAIILENEELMSELYFNALNRGLVNESGAIANLIKRFGPKAAQGLKTFGGGLGKYVAAPAAAAGTLGGTALWGLGKLGSAVMSPSVLLPVGLATAGGIGLMHLKNKGDKEKTKAQLKQAAGKMAGKGSEFVKRGAQKTKELGQAGIKMTKKEYEAFKEKRRQQAQQSKDTSSGQMELPFETIQYIDKAPIEELSHLIVIGAKAKDIMNETTEFSYKPIITENNEIHLEDMSLLAMNEMIDNIYLESKTKQMNEKLGKMIFRGALGAGLGALGGKMAKNYATSDAGSKALDKFTYQKGKSPGETAPPLAPQEKKPVFGKKRSDIANYARTGDLVKHGAMAGGTIGALSGLASDDEKDESVEEAHLEETPMQLQMAQGAVQKVGALMKKAKSEKAAKKQNEKAAYKKGVEAGKKQALAAPYGIKEDKDDEDEKTILQKVAPLAIGGALGYGGYKMLQNNPEIMNKLKAGGDKTANFRNKAKPYIDRSTGKATANPYKDSDEGWAPDYLQGKEGIIPDYLQGKEGLLPDFIQGYLPSWMPGSLKRKKGWANKDLEEVLDNLKELRADKVDETISRKVTIKEVNKWLSRLEENKYKKTYINDAKRIAWLVNNKLSEDYSKMPARIQRKTEGVSYARERYLAKEYIKHINSKQIDELTTVPAYGHHLVPGIKKAGMNPAKASKTIKNIGKTLGKKAVKRTRVDQGGFVSQEVPGK